MNTQQLQQLKNQALGKIQDAIVAAKNKRYREMEEFEKWMADKTGVFQNCEDVNKQMRVYISNAYSR